MECFESAIYKTAFRETKNPAVITDSNFVIQDVNEACIDFTGYSRDELVGDTPINLFSEPVIYEAMIESLAKGEPWVGGFETTMKDGRMVYGRGSCVPVRIDGELRGYAGFFSDLTERRQYEQSLRILNRVLRHNLRNDANVILGHVDIVADELEDEELVRSLSTARNRIDSIIKYAETARNLDELLSERTDPSLAPVRLDELLRDELRSAQKMYPEAEFSAELGTDPVFVAADDAAGTAIEAVFENAVEHNDSSVPTVSVRLDSDDSVATVTVADDGPGISANEHDLIFGREEISPLHHGQGLDLFFVARLLEKYGGGIGVENGDEGAVFKLRFRAIPAENIEENREDSNPN
ncbi:PAS domain S-box protein [Haladaptatus pallidirubidus]|uniref:histidine kinase n=1 Tax=Haladaptatus pallidirubidus TaxID=1008152 RepID=A0AAV3UE54_9EURY|nr:PAS domain-containing sensor histidine kinase [Haladaptatus pallidirubidus]